MLKHLAAGGFELGYDFGGALELGFCGLVDGELLVDEFFEHFAAHAFDGFGRSTGGVGLAQHLVDLVHRDFFRPHAGGHLGGGLFVVFFAARR